MRSVCIIVLSASLVWLAPARARAEGVAFVAADEDRTLSVRAGLGPQPPLAVQPVCLGYWYPELDRSGWPVELHPYTPALPRANGLAYSTPWYPFLIPAGRLTLESDPPDAELFVDGVRVKQRDPSGYALTLLEGRHLIQARAAGHQGHSGPIDIPGGSGLIVSIRLRPDHREPLQGSNNIVEEE